MTLKYTLSKSLDIAFISVIYFIFALVIAEIIDKLINFRKNSDKEEKNTQIFYDVIEVLIHICIITIAYHFIRENIISCCIPLPFSKLFGYKYKITEKAGTILTSFAFINGSDKLVKKVKNIVAFTEKKLKVDK